MSQFKGNKKRVARELGISRSYLYKRLKEVGL
jgi:transcriptional regulator of acetoin/glycerol metabolism